MKFLYARLFFSPRWNQPQGWKWNAFTWIKIYPFVIAYGWCTPEVAKVWFEN